MCIHNKIIFSILQCYIRNIDEHRVHSANPKKTNPEKMMQNDI